MCSNWIPQIMGFPLEIVTFGGLLGALIRNTHSCSSKIIIVNQVEAQSTICSSESSHGQGENIEHPTTPSIV